MEGDNDEVQVVDGPSGLVLAPEVQSTEKFIPEWGLTTSEEMVTVGHLMIFLRHCFPLVDQLVMEKILDNPTY